MLRDNVREIKVVWEEGKPAMGQAAAVGNMRRITHASLRGGVHMMGLMMRMIGGDVA
jgi:hypothetical protein